VRTLRYPHVRTLVSVIGLGLLLARVEPALASSRSLTMTGFSPASGPVGTVVTITGSGFVSGDIVAFNGTDASSSTALSGGSKLKASVPAYATSGPITVTDPSTGQTVGLPGTSFSVTTGIFPSPSKTWAGSPILLAGSALTPNVGEQIFIGKLQVGTADTDGSGNFEARVTVPWTEPSGTVKIIVIDPAIGQVIFPMTLFGAWPIYRHDSALTALNSDEKSLSVSNAPNLVPKWSEPDDPRWYVGTSFPPLVAGGIVFVGVPTCQTFNGCHWELAADDAATGTRMWSWDPMNGPAVEVAGLVIFPSGTSLVALNATTGSQVWSESTLVGAPLVAQGSTAYLCAGNLVSALDPLDGSVLWSFAVNNSFGSKPFCSIPALSSGKLFVSYSERFPDGGGSAYSTVFALSASTGKPLWSHDFNAPNYAVMGSPAVGGSRVFVGAEAGIGASGTVEFALDAGTGQQLWSFTGSGTPSRPAPATVDGTTVFVNFGNFLDALDTAAGTIKWQAAGLGGCAPPPSAASGVIYGGTCDGYLYAVDESNGNGILYWDGGDGGQASDVAIANGMIYVDFGTSNIYGGTGHFAAFGLP
jgi:outer membrane protein assembly factor BamB